MPPDPIPKLMTTRQAAKLIGKRPTFVARMIQEQRLAHYKLDGRILISEADLKAFLESCRTPAREDPPRRRPVAKVRGKMSSCFDHLEKTHAWRGLRRNDRADGTGGQVDAPSKARRYRIGRCAHPEEDPLVGKLN